MSCEGFELGAIPYFDQDLEDRGNPEPVKELREKIRAYDAVLIARPEYDYASRWCQSGVKSRAFEPHILTPADLCHSFLPVPSSLT
jgi:hypothetical protein